MNDKIDVMLDCHSGRKLNDNNQDSASLIILNYRDKITRY